jgi:hypothetical protein
MITTTLALTGIFGSGKTMMIDVVAFLVIVVIVVGGAHSIRAHMREGAGSGITSTIGTIVHASLLALSLAIAAGVVAWAHSHGADSQAPTAVVQPWQ